MPSTPSMARLLAPVAAAACLLVAAPATRAALVLDSVQVDGLFHPQVPGPEGFERGYTLKLGFGGNDFPYVDVFVDDAVGQSSYAALRARDAYLTYLDGVQVFAVTPGAEISATTVGNGSFTPFFQAGGLGGAPGVDLVSTSGNAPDIYLGFSLQRTLDGIEPPAYGWAHLRYTQVGGLTLVDSALTTSDAGIYALSTRTISSVDETSAPLMLGLGALSLMGLRAGQLRRQREEALPSKRLRVRSMLARSA